MGKVPKAEHCAEAFGYSFEKMVLYAWPLGIGTTWIGAHLIIREYSLRNSVLIVSTGSMTAVHRIR
ncbi:MAG: hypothetical protein J6I96_04885 [Oscillospiraceae bacterium]|nr:hypothetical protein [Oscillospiraceae bacterium]